MSDEIRTLEVRTRSEGTFRIDIPASWKVTFSKVNPQAGGFECMALRVYEADEKQRACFTEVQSFRDISIPFKKRVKKSKETTKNERNGNKWRSEHEAEIDYEWTDET